MRALLTVMLVAISACFIPGCSEDATTKAADTYKADYSTPQGVLEALVEFYVTENISAYPDLFAEDYQFEPQQLDLGITWSRDAEILSFTNMCESEAVTSIDLLMSFDGPETLTVDDRTVLRFTGVNLLLQVHTNVNATTFRVDGDLQLFHLRQGETALGEDSGRYYVARWLDIAGSSAGTGITAIETTTWSAIKKQF